MYRNLEEDRRPPRAAADKSEEASCPCQCKAPAEQDRSPQPAADHNAVDLGLYWDYHGDPEA
jgi:hypothetical protein